MTIIVDAQIHTHHFATPRAAAAGSPQVRYPLPTESPERARSVTNSRRLGLESDRVQTYLSCMSFLTDLTPSTALATLIADLMSSRELTKPLS